MSRVAWIFNFSSDFVQFFGFLKKRDFCLLDWFTFSLKPFRMRRLPVYLIIAIFYKNWCHTRALSVCDCNFYLCYCKAGFPSNATHAMQWTQL